MKDYARPIRTKLRNIKTAVGRLPTYAALQPDSAHYCLPSACRAGGPASRRREHLCVACPGAPEIFCFKWLSYAQAERKLSSDLLEKPVAARSIPESTKVYRDWLGRRMDVFADDTRSLLTDAKKLADVGARLFAIDMAERAQASAAPPAATEVN